MTTKVVKDTVKNAGTLLAECRSMMTDFVNAYQWVQPSNSVDAMRVGGPAKYIVASRVGLQKFVLTHFDITYPTITRVVSEGSTSEYDNDRLVDAIYKISKLNEILQENKHLLKTDELRTRARKYMDSIIGDVAVFMLSQFKLNRTDGAIYLSVQEYCNKEGLTQDVLYGEVVSIMEMVNEFPYGYEEISDYYEELVSIDPAFVAECAEAQFPLTREISYAITTQQISLGQAYNMLHEYTKKSVVKEIEGIDPLNMISKLNLK